MSWNTEECTELVDISIKVTKLVTSIYRPVNSIYKESQTMTTNAVL